MADVEIREIREGDVEAVIAVDNKLGSFRRAGWWRGLLGLYIGEAAPSDSLAPVFCQVAILEGKLIGFILGDIQAWQFGIPRCGRIVAIGVDPEHTRKGVASKLARSLLEVFSERNLPHVQCLARADDPMFAFFSSLGFQPSDQQVLERRLEP